MYQAKRINLLDITSLLISITVILIGISFTIDYLLPLAWFHQVLTHELVTKAIIILSVLLSLIYLRLRSKYLLLQTTNSGNQLLTANIARYQAIIEDQVELICRYRQDATVSYANEAFCRYFGISKDLIINHQYTPVIYEPDRAKVFRLIGSMNVANPAVTIENRIIAQGKIRWTQWNNRMIFDRLGNFVEYQAVGRDITALKEIETKLRESEEKFRRAFEDAATGEALVALDGQFIKVNRSLCEIAGYAESELLSKTFQEITHPDDLDLDLNYVRQMLAGKIRTYQMEKRYFHRQGHVIWILLSVSMIKNIEDQPLYFIAQIQDINQRKTTEAQLDKLLKELERSNEELEEFASIVSHDLISPVRKQQMLLDLLQDDYGEVLDREGKQALERMMQLNTRMERLIRNLLTYAKVNIQAKPFTEVSLNEVIQEVLLQLEPRIATTKAQIKIDKLPIVKGDRFQLFQLFQNLLQNALKFYSPQRTLKIQVYIASDSNQLSKNYIQIAISDNGIGFEATEQIKIFSPFHRLHGYREYEGTGLGLAICEKIVKHHYGKIVAQGKPNHGSIFTVFLPNL